MPVTIFNFSSSIDYYSPFEIILDEFLRSNPASFDKFQVRCGNLDEILSECEKKLVELETKCHTVVVNEKPQVRGVDLYLKSKAQPMRLKDIIQFLKDTYSSPWWESSNSKSLTMGASASLYEVHGVPTKQAEEEG